MDTLEQLKKKAKVSADANYRSFRAAAKLVADYQIPAVVQNPNDLLSEISRTYNLIAEAVIAGQNNDRARTRARLTGAATRLAAAAVLFHLNFFAPNFLGQTDSPTFQKCLRQMTLLFREKNRDYGNSFRVWGIPGLLVRLGDKLFRLEQLSHRGYRPQVKDEHLPDTALDLANYALMLLMLLQEGRALKLGR